MKLTDDILDLNVFLAGDGAQIELRMLAQLADDELLLDIFKKHAADRKNPLLDPHCVEGHLLTGWPVERIKQDQTTRRMTKNTVFGICYGLGEESVYPYVVAKIRSVEGPNANLAGITPERCMRTHRKFFKVHEGVKRFQDRMRIEADSSGHVASLFGFDRDVRKTDDKRHTYWGNQAINSPVQSSAHTFLLICLALLDEREGDYSRLRQCLMEVHDALYFQVPLRHLPEAYAQFMKLFEKDAVHYANNMLESMYQAWLAKRKERKLAGMRVRPEEPPPRALKVPMLAEAKAGFTMASMVDYEGEPISTFLEHWREKQRKVDAKSWKELAQSVA